MNKGRIGLRRFGWLTLFVLLLILSLLTGKGVAGQESEPSVIIEVDRQVGFALGSRIQGTFLVSAYGPAELARVEFLVDGQLLGEDPSAPFEIRLQTSTYSAGTHTLSAVGFLDDGQILESNTLRREFVSGNWVIVVLVIVIVSIVAVRLLPAFISSRQESGSDESRGYGYLGGAVCQRCRRPFGLNFWSPRLLVGRLQRCPHCGKWQLARRASIESLVEAERKQKEFRGTKDRIETGLDEERFSQMLEDSRFEDS